MRSMWLSVAIVAWLGGEAHAGGLFVEEGIGGASYRGDLAPFGGAPRVQISLGIRSGPYTLSILGGATVPDMFYIDCYGDECDPQPTAGYTFGGIDLKRAWPIAGRYEHAAVRLFMHGGARWYSGDNDIEGYAGPGASGGAGIEGDCWLIGYSLDFGLDAMWLRGAPLRSDEAARGPASGLASTGDIFAATPYIMFSGRLGWM